VRVNGIIAHEDQISPANPRLIRFNHIDQSPTDVPRLLFLPDRQPDIVPRLLGAKGEVEAVAGGVGN
jgi:hypothetical protein